MASDGGIFSFGGAPFYGSTGGMVLNKPVVGMAATPDGGGYWLVASDGGIFSYGDAGFYGSTGSHRAQQADRRHGADARRQGLLARGLRRRDLLLRRRQVLRQHRQHAAQQAGRGDGGDAERQRATGWSPPTAASSPTATRRSTAAPAAIVLNKPIIGMITGPGGGGYFLVASDGGIFSFGTAPFYGSLGGLPLKHPIVAAAAIADRQRVLVHRHRRASSRTSAQPSYYGSAPSPLYRPIVGMAEAPGQRAASSAGRYPSGSYGFDISNFQCASFPTGDHPIGIVQVDGASLGPTPTRAWRRRRRGRAAG